MKSEAEEKQLETEFNCNYNDEPTCPYCGHKQEDELGEFVGSWEDEAQWEATCYSCDKNYLAYTCVSYRFDTVKLPCGNENPHKMRHMHKLWENKHIFKCIWCDMKVRKELSASPTSEEKQDFEIESMIGR